MGRKTKHTGCIVDGCSGGHMGLGYCKKHYYTLVTRPKYGITDDRPYTRKQLAPQECLDCGVQSTDIIQKNKYGEVLQICRSCYGKRKYKNLKTEEGALLECEHHSEKIGRSNLCPTCYIRMWKLNAKTICGSCGKKTKKSLKPLCASCKKPKVNKNYVITNDDKSKMKIFLIKQKWDLLSLIDLLRMIDLYLNLHQPTAKLDAYNTPSEVKDYVLHCFKTLIV